VHQKRLSKAIFLLIAFWNRRQETAKDTAPRDNIDKYYKKNYSYNGYCIFFSSVH